MANAGVITTHYILGAGEIANNDPYRMYFRGFRDPISRPQTHTLRSLQIILSDGTSTDDLKVNVFETGMDPDGADDDPSVLDALDSKYWTNTSTDWFEGESQIDNTAGAVSEMIHDDAHFTAVWIKIEITRIAGSADDATAEVIDIEEVS